MDLIDPRGERLEGRGYTPSDFQESLGAGNSATFELNGKDGNPFGISQILPFAGAPSDVVVTEIAHNRGRDPFITSPGVGVEALHRFFRSYRLDAPFVIEEDKSLVVKMKNRGTSATDVGITLPGLTASQLKTRRRTLRQQLGVVPEPRTVYGRESVAANTSYAGLKVSADAEQQVFNRLSVSTSGSDAAIRIRIRTGHVTVMPESYIDTVTRRYDRLHRYTPYEIGARSDFDAEATNTSGSAEDVSVFAVTYVQKQVQAALKG